MCQCSRTAELLVLGLGERISSGGEHVLGTLEKLEPVGELGEGRATGAGKQETTGTPL